MESDSFLFVLGAIPKLLNNTDELSYHRINMKSNLRNILVEFVKLRKSQSSYDLYEKYNVQHTTDQ